MMDAAYPVGFIGLGIRGEAMALTLVKAGTQLLVWNPKRPARRASPRHCSMFATHSMARRVRSASVTLTWRPFSRRSRHAVTANRWCSTRRTREDT